MPPFPSPIRIDGPDTDEEVLVFKYDWTDETELGPSITNVVAEFTDVPPERIATEVGRRVDFDGLDRVFSSPSSGIHGENSHLVLALPSCDITIYGDGWVEIVRTSD